MKKHLTISWINFESKKFISMLSVLSVTIGILTVGVVFLASEIDYYNRMLWMPPSVNDRYYCNIRIKEPFKAPPLLMEQVDDLKRDTQGIIALKTDGGFDEKFNMENKPFEQTVHAVNAGYFEYTGAVFIRRNASIYEFMRSDDSCYIGNGLAKKMKGRKANETVGMVIHIKGMNFVVKGIIRFPRMPMEYFDSDGIYISPRGYRRFQPFFSREVKRRIYRVWSIGVLTEPGKHKEAMRTLDMAIRKRLEGRNPFTCIRMKSDINISNSAKEFKTAQTIVWCSVAASLFMIFASVLGIQLAVSLQKKRQIAMNRVFGADNRSIMIQTFLEILIQAFAGTVIAAACSPIVFPLVLRFIYFDKTQFPIDFMTVGKAMAVAAAIVMIISLSTALILSRRIAKLSVIECLK